MAQVSFSYLGLVIVLCWTMTATVVTPTRGKVLSDYHGIPGQGAVETDLMSLLTHQAKESQYLREAQAIINEVQSAPTCNQLAAYQLLTSCKNLEVGADGTETPILLERVKNLYAARLAVCELQSAHAQIPAQCKDVMSISLGDLANEEQPRLNRFWCGRDCVDAKVLQPCLKALHDKSTSWTSYSNNRAQAIIMCHAIRDHLEREQTAAAHRKLVMVVSKLTDETSDVSRVLSETQQRHMANQAEVQDLFETFLFNIHREMSLFAETGVEVVDLLSGVSLSAASLQTDLQTMRANIQNATSDVEAVRQGVIGVLKPVVEASSEISSHLVDMKDFMELAEPFLSKGTEMVQAVNIGLQRLQAAQMIVLHVLPKLGLMSLLTVLGRCARVRKRRIILANTAIFYGSYAINPMVRMLSSATSTCDNLISTLPGWFRANDDVTTISGLVIIAVTFAVISCFWVDSIREARTELKVKQKRKSVPSVRRHDRHKNLAIDPGLPKYHQDIERDRFTRAGTAPP